MYWTARFVYVYINSKQVLNQNSLVYFVSYRKTSKQLCLLADIAFVNELDCLEQIKVKF